MYFAFLFQDFGDSIPGHGGITDRMDCQVNLLTCMSDRFASMTPRHCPSMHF